MTTLRSMSLSTLIYKLADYKRDKLTHYLIPVIEDIIKEKESQIDGRQVEASNHN